MRTRLGGGMRISGAPFLLHLLTSVDGTSRRFAAMQQYGRFRAKPT
jgi:hypothetical protein